MTVADEYSPFLLTKPLRTKVKACDEVLLYVRWFAKKIGKPIRQIHTDGGTEFCKVKATITERG